MSDFALILSDWNLNLISANPTEEEALRGLTEKVQDLLMNNRKYLFQALYRLDVDEEKVNWVMQREPKDRQALRLAELIFKREMQKAKTRSAYGQQDTTGNKPEQESADQNQRRLSKKD